jgi:hypothetical protein
MVDNGQVASLIMYESTTAMSEISSRYDVVQMSIGLLTVV